MAYNLPIIIITIFILLIIHNILAFGIVECILPVCEVFPINKLLTVECNFDHSMRIIRKLTDIIDENSDNDMKRRATSSLQNIKQYTVKIFRKGVEIEPNNFTYYVPNSKILVTHKFNGNTNADKDLNRQDIFRCEIHNDLFGIIHKEILLRYGRTRLFCFLLKQFKL